MANDVYTSKYVNKKKQAVRRTTGYYTTKSIIGRGTNNGKYGQYKQRTYASDTYDPVARHERYLRERASLGIGKGRGGGGGGSGGGSKGGSGKGGGGKGGKGSAKQGNSNLAAEIQKLREESALDTEAQREAAKRKIADLKEQLKKHMEMLSDSKESEDQQQGVNVSEIKGKIQSIREQIQSTGGDLQKWITHEKDSLEKRIAALYSANGIKYTPVKQSDKTKASKARDKEVKSRADSVYKRTSKK